MENKQTGWVPDFPDVKDYTLKSKQIHKALQPIQATQIIGSLESQKETIIELLKQIEGKTTDQKKNEVISLQKRLKEGMANEVCLVEAELLISNHQIQTERNKNPKIGEFIDIERIPSKVFDIIIREKFKESGSDLLRLRERKKGIRLTKVVYPIVNVIAQILAPLGEHDNLQKAVS
ncbi:MAG TPA: hypothetical protein VIQ31_13330, partial [Phormidium sp.]